MCVLAFAVYLQKEEVVIGKSFRNDTKRKKDEKLNDKIFYGNKIISYYVF